MSTRVVRPFGTMATGEEDDLEVLPLPRRKQELGHPFKPFAPLSLQGEHDCRPLQLGRSDPAPAE